jgi:N-acyl-D-amino-acid deacylase
LQAGGPAATLAALADPKARARLLAGEKFTDAYLGNVYLGALPGDAARYAGLSVAQAAAQASQPAGEWVLGLLAETGLNAGGHLDRLAFTSDDMAWLMRHDRHAAGSDGIYQGQRPHPRGYATFARLAGYYLADGPDTGYQRLVRHLAVTAADAFGLAGRGRLAPGMAADICVIGPGGMSAHASYGEPLLPATGVELVLVNGTIVWNNGSAVAGRFPGRLVA